ncbi:NUDIX hydrolase domain-like protein [Kalaharituber pfeilii]|nr:NUDIX hydrolase domain-like protein [Kalaharituber pfeilii]
MPEHTCTPAVVKKEKYESSLGGVNGEKTKWVRLVKITYKNQNGETATWEAAERTTRPEGVEIDGVAIIAVLDNGNEPEILLQKQFRPPVGRMCIEFPAGLIDAGETPEECALRELHEETGYIGEIVQTNNGSERSCVMFNDPGFCNTNLHYIHVKIDMNDQRNKNPVPKLEPHEIIECFTVPLKDLYVTCRDMEREGYAIDVNVGALAEGFEVARKWRFL